MKILWISYYFYPLSGVGPNKNTFLIEEFERKGHSILVLTSNPNIFNAKIENLHKDNKVFNTIRIPSIANHIFLNKIVKGIKKVFKKNKIHYDKNIEFNNVKVNSVKKFIKDIINFIDYQHSWFIMWKINKFRYMDSIKKFNPDIIYVSTPPHTGILIANDIKKSINKPVVLEYRDLWTGSHHYNKINILKKLEYKLEKKLLKNIDFFTFATHGIAHKHNKLFGYKNYKVIYNFFVNRVHCDTITNSREIIFIYAGTLLNQYNYDIFIEGLEKLMLNKNLKIKVKIYSSNGDILKKYIKNKKLLEIFEFGYEADINKLDKLHCQSSIFITFLFNKKFRGVVSSKNFYYLNFNKPIFVFGVNECQEVKQVLQNNYFFIDSVKKFVQEIEKFTKNSLKYKNSQYYINSHSLKNRAILLEDIFKNVIEEYTELNK